MVTRKWMRVFVLLSLAAAVAVALAPAPAGASYVEPVLVPGNPDCTDLGYDFGFKPQPEPPPSGTYVFPGDLFNSVTISSDGIYFDWTSTLGVDAVIVKGGTNANVYAYDPEAFSGSGLHSPINPNNGTPYAISHIEFCYDYEVEVSKTAETSFTRTWEWAITKSVDPADFHLFAGAGADAQYTVEVVKTGYTDSDWAVSGSILIENHTPFEAVIEDVSDEISGFGAVAVECGVVFPHTLPSGGSLSCSYVSLLPDGSNRINTADVTTSGIVGGNSATADVLFGEPTTVVNGSINVTDTNDMSWGPVDDDATWNYPMTFDCSGDPAAYSDGSYAFGHVNTATIVETGQSDDALVTVTCYAPVVSKTAETSYNRYWDWTIDKTADPSSLLLSVGQQFLVNYLVTVGATYSDDDFAVAGTITVQNPNPQAAMEVSLEDVISDGVVAQLDCASLLTVPAGGSATCGYSADLPDKSDRLNTATATLNGIGFEGTADVTFGDPTDHVDECIDLGDTFFDGPQGTVCVAELPKTYSYSIWVGPYDVCGAYSVENTASFVTNDSGSVGSDAVTIPVNVPCEGGCTLTPGYWKTHSAYGPAPYDETWAQIGEDTPFFLSGQSYHDVLWTAPQGNAYFILAHAYIAAELNFLNESDPTAAQAAFDESTVLFLQYTPDEVAAMKGKMGKETRAQFIDLATILDDYNNGLIGPGHCTE